MKPRPDSVGRITPMWLAHHFPDDYGRCVRIGRSHVCRRCSVLYPVAFAVMFATYGRSWPETTDIAALVLLPVPSVIELVLEQFGILRYHPLRQVLVTVPLAVGLGRGFAIYLGDQSSRIFWVPVIAYSAVCVAAVVWRHRRDSS